MPRKAPKTTWPSALGAISVAIIDLTGGDEVDPYKLGKKMRLVSSLPIFGVLDKFLIYIYVLSNKQTVLK